MVDLKGKISHPVFSCQRITLVENLLQLLFLGNTVLSMKFVKVYQQSSNAVISQQDAVLPTSAVA